MLYTEHTFSLQTVLYTIYQIELIKKHIPYLILSYRRYLLSWGLNLFLQTCQTNLSKHSAQFSLYLILFCYKHLKINIFRFFRFTNHFKKNTYSQEVQISIVIGTQEMGLKIEKSVEECTKSHIDNKHLLDNQTSKIPFNLIQVEQCNIRRIICFLVIRIFTE